MQMAHDGEHALAFQQWPPKKCSSLLIACKEPQQPCFCFAQNLPHDLCSRLSSLLHTLFIAVYTPSSCMADRRHDCRYVRSLAPNIHPPRWVVSLALNRFLDQDTYLLATQQSVTLSNELRNIAEQRWHSSGDSKTQATSSQASDTQTADRRQADGAAGESGQDREAAAAAAPMARRSWYCHRSPTDNILVASGKWMDKAVPDMPNRYQGLLTSSLQGKACLNAQGNGCDSCGKHTNSRVGVLSSTSFLVDFDMLIVNGHESIGHLAG